MLRPTNLVSLHSRAVAAAASLKDATIGHLCSPVLFTVSRRSFALPSLDAHKPHSPFVVLLLLYFDFTSTLSLLYCTTAPASEPLPVVFAFAFASSRSSVTLTFFRPRRRFGRLIRIVATASKHEVNLHCIFCHSFNTLSLTTYSILRYPLSFSSSFYFFHLHEA